MEAYYEQKRDYDSNIFIKKFDDLSFPTHFHLSLEIVLLKKGNYQLFINGEKYNIISGCIAIIDSFDLHSYINVDGTDNVEGRILILPYNNFFKFNLLRNNMSISEPIINCPSLCNELIDFIDKFLLNKNEFDETTQPAIDLFLSILYKNLKFNTLAKSGELELIRKILLFIEKNYKNQINRDVISKELGYTKEHISRVFHRYLQKGINTYINELRLKYIYNKRKEGDKRTEFALLYEAGFNSQQTYYRVKKKHNTKKTP